MEMGIDTQKRWGRELSLGLCKKVDRSGRTMYILQKTYSSLFQYKTVLTESYSATIIPNSWIGQTKLSDATETCSLPYGVALNVQDTSTYQSSRVKKTNSMVTVSDRTNDKEAYVLSFVGENSVPLSRLIVPN